MLNRAAEQIGNGRQVDVRVRPHIHALAWCKLRRTELIDENERPDHCSRLGWQGAPHIETAQIVRAGRDGESEEITHPASPGASVFIVSAWTRSRKSSARA